MFLLTKSKKKNLKIALIVRAEDLLKKNTKIRLAAMAVCVFFTLYRISVCEYFA